MQKGQFPFAFRFALDGERKELATLRQDRDTLRAARRRADPAGDMTTAHRRWTPEELDELASAFEGAAVYQEAWGYPATIKDIGGVVAMLRQAARDARTLAQLRAYLDGASDHFSCELSLEHDPVERAKTLGKGSFASSALAELDRLEREPNG